MWRPLAGGALLALLLCPASPAPGQPSVAAAASPDARASETGSLETVAELLSLEEAEALAEELRAEGREVRLRRQEQERMAYELAIGYYTTRRQAEDLQTILGRHGIHGRIYRPDREGFVFSLGLFLTHQEAAEMVQRVEELGHPVTLSREVPTRVDVYLVEQVREPPAPKEPELPAVLVAEPRVTEAPEGWLRAGFFGARSEAETVARDLNRLGLTTWVLHVVGRGYAVGVDPSVAEVDRVTLRRFLEGQGHRGVQVAEVLPRPAAPAPPEIDAPDVDDEAIRLAQLELPDAELEESDVLVFGRPGQAARLPDLPAGQRLAERRPFQIDLGQIRLETQGLRATGDNDVRSHSYATVAAGASWTISDSWELRLAGRLDGYYQTGESTVEELRADYGESYLRFRRGPVRLTLGPQTVLWGRVSVLPPSDRLSVIDLSRFLPIEPSEQRRPSPAARLEIFSGGWKVDLLALPTFRAAELAPEGGLWFPIDSTRGEILGFPSDPVVAELARLGTFRDVEPDEPGGGIRVSHIGSRVDFGVTVLRAHQSIPYLSLDEGVRAALLAGLDVESALAAATGPTFLGLHPESDLVGLDLGFQAGGAIWRLEAAYLSDLPVTTEDLRFTLVEGLEWAAEVEVPVGAAGRLNLIVSGRHVDPDFPILDDRDALRLTGLLEGLFARDRWRGRLAFSAALEGKDLYTAPEIAYRGLEPFEFFLGFRLFSGDPGTLAGFHRHHNLAEVGWRLRY